MTVCTYISGAVCLTANNIFNPYHEDMEIDNDMIMVSFRFLEDMIREAPSEPLKRLRDSWDELLQHARARSTQFTMTDTDWLGRI
jgi:hypothetical protein